MLGRLYKGGNQMLRKSISLVTGLFLAQLASAMQSQEIQSREKSVASSSSGVLERTLEERFEEVKPHILNHAFQGCLSEIKDVLADSPTCFLSYAWGVKENEEFVHQVADFLKTAGIKTYLDIKDNLAGSFISRFTEKIGESDKVILFGSQRLRKKYDAIGAGSVINIEISQIFTELRRYQEKVIPVILDGSIQTSLPPFLADVVSLDFRNPNLQFEHTFSLLKRIVPEKEQDIKPIIEEFSRIQRLINSSLDDIQKQDFINRHEAQRRAREDLDKQLIGGIIDKYFAHQDNAIRNEERGYLR